MGLTAPGLPAARHRPRPITRRPPTSSAGGSRPCPPPHNPSTGDTRGLAILDCQLAVHDDVANTCAELMRPLVRGVILDRVGIENDQISKIPGFEPAAVLE